MRSITLVIGIVLIASAGYAGETSHLSTLANSTGSDPGALVALGDLYVEAEKLDDARKTYRQALKIDKKNGEAEFGIVRIEMAKGKFEKAKRACRRIARKYRQSSVGDVCSGWFWISYDRSARAMDEFNKAIEKGDTARGKTGMGEALRRRADYADAISAYKEAISAGADYVAHLGLGIALEENGNNAEALKSLEKAVSMQPASCLAQFHYGRLLEASPKAVKHLEAALAIRPNWTDAYIALGDAQLALGYYPAAVEAFNSAIKGKEGRAEAHYGRGRALLKMGKKEEALEALDKAIEIIPNYVGAILLVADIQYNSGKLEEAIKALEKARNVAPGDVEVYLNSGDIYFRMGRHTSARTYLNQAISMNSKISKAHAILGHIACERRLYDSGRQHYKRALEGDLVGIDKKEIHKLSAACKPKH